MGDGDNVCNSWAVGAALAGIRFVAATPRGYEPAPDVLALASKLSKPTGGSVSAVYDPMEAVADADCVMTDTFVSMGFEKEQEERLKAFMPEYRVTKTLMSRAKEDAVFEHCLPAHRGEEVDPAVIDGPQSVVFEEAENRLHTEKALLCFQMQEKGRYASLMS